VSDRPEEPPVTDELPEMIQRASEVDDPTAYRLCDVVIAARRRAARRAKGVADLRGETEHDPRPAA
jgi:hypothetical protein